MRLFTGLDLPPEVTGKLGELLGRLRPTARIHWSPVENLHITTKFIGEWPEERLEELKAALEAMRRDGSFEVAIRWLGFMPNSSAPRIFRCGVQSARLAGLVHATDQVTGSLGIAQEWRPHTPHLTLARIKDRDNIEVLRRSLAGEISEFGSFEARSFFLYLSQLRPSGSVYTKLSEFPL